MTFNNALSLLITSPTGTSALAACCANSDFPFNVLFTAGNESCPQPQTSEHLAAIEIMKLKHIIILQNKIDLVKESQAKEQYDQILKFVQGKNKFIAFTNTCKCQRLGCNPKLDDSGKKKPLRSALRRTTC